MVYTKKQLQAMTEAELAAVAEGLGLEAPATATPKELIDAIWAAEPPIAVNEEVETAVVVPKKIRIILQTLGDNTAKAQFVGVNDAYSAFIPFGVEVEVPDFVIPVLQAKQVHTTCAERSDRTVDYVDREFPRFALTILGEAA